MKLSFEKKSSVKKKLGVGEYISVVRDIRFRDDFKGNDAFIVSYELEDAKGIHYPFYETFYNKVSNERTRSFFEYLQSNGISLDECDKFVGCRERITLKKHLKNNVAFLTIVDREFICAAEGKIDVVAD